MSDHQRSSSGDAVILPLYVGHYLLISAALYFLITSVFVLQITLLPVICGAFAVALAKRQFSKATVSRRQNVD